MTSTNHNPADTLSGSSEPNALRRTTGLLTIILISALAIFELLCTSLGLTLYQSSRQLADLNGQYQQQWQKIAQQLIHVQTRAEAELLTDAVLVDSRETVTHLLEREAVLKEEISHLVDNSRLHYKVLRMSSAEKATFTSADIDVSFRESARQLATAPLELLRDGFSTRKFTSTAELRSGSALQPLVNRSQTIANIYARSLETIWTLQVIFSVCVIAGIWGAWTRILRPAIRQLESAVDQAHTQVIDRVETQRFLADKEAETRLILDNFPGLVASCDKELRYLSANYFYRQTMRVDNSTDIVGKHIKDVVGRRIWEMISPHIDRVLAGYTTTYDTQLDLEDGMRHVQVTYVPGRDFRGEVSRFFVFIIDVDDRHKAAEKLGRSEENLRTTLNSIGDAVIATDSIGRIIRMNPIAEKLSGYSFKEVSGQLLRRVFHVVGRETGDEVDDPVNQILNKGEITEPGKDSILISRSSQEIQISYTAAPIKNSTEEIVGVVLVFRDVSKEFALRQQLSHYEKMQAIGNLAGGIAHDFNNILAGISGAAEALAIEEESTISTKGIDYLDFIVQTTQRASDLTEKLTTFAGNTIRENTLHSVVTDFQDVIAISNRTLDKKIRISIKNSALQTCIHGSRGAIQSAFLNIVINAAHAMPNGGLIAVEIKNINLTEQQCQSSIFKLAPGPHIEVSVRDTGVGIASQDIDRVFEPFFSTKTSTSGSGLGLSTAYGTVLDLHGAIYVDSQPGEGSCFRIQLPVVESSAHATVESENSIDQPGEGLILLVDDEELLLLTGSNLLQHMGYEVITASNGPDAIKLYHKHSHEIDLVVMDVNMPVMTGIETTRELKKINDNVNVVISTGFSDANIIKDGKQYGIVSLLHKPFTLQQFRKIVAEALHKSGAV